MTLGKASLMTMGFVASLGVGVWIAPYVTDAKVRDVEPIAAAAPVRDAATAPAPVTRSTTATRETTARLASVPPTAPELHKRMKSVLTRGADPELAATGFESGEQFATVAYLARNTGIPFALLKHRVLYEGRSLDKAVTMSKPDVNAQIEVARARAEARAEIWAISEVKAS
jgi:hypothetical protein